MNHRVLQRENFARREGDVTAAAELGKLDHVGVLRASLSVARLVKRARTYSPELSRHGEQVARWSTAIGRRLGLNGQDLLVLRWAACLHDVGKVTWPLELWESAGGLTAQERAFVNGHAEASERLVLEHGLGILAPAVRAHHERWDGAGYPHGVFGRDIPLAARIISVADVYDVLRAGRPYRPALDARAALAELRRCAGTQFDPACVAALAEVLAQTSAPVPSASAPSFAIMV